LDLLGLPDEERVVDVETTRLTDRRVSRRNGPSPAARQRGVPKARSVPPLNEALPRIHWAPVDHICVIGRDEFVSRPAGAGSRDALGNLAAPASRFKSRRRIRTRAESCILAGAPLAQSKMTAEPPSSIARGKLRFAESKVATCNRPSIGKRSRESPGRDHRASAPTSPARAGGGLSVRRVRNLADGLAFRAGAQRLEALEEIEGPSGVTLPLFPRFFFPRWRRRNPRPEVRCLKTADERGPEGQRSPRSRRQRTM